MEILIIWVIVGIIARIFSASENQKKKRPVTPPRRAGSAARMPSQAQTQPQQKKKSGLLDTFIEQLRELEEQEKQKERGAYPRPAAAASAQQIQRTEKQAAMRYREEKEEKHKKRLEKKPAVREAGPVAYPGRTKNTYTLENLERRFPDPAHRMMVFSEIMEKPKALRKQ